MRSKRIITLLLPLVVYACGGAQQSAAPAAEPAPTLPLPPPPPPQPPQPPTPLPATAATYDVGPSDTTLTVNFAQAHKHPEAARVDAVLRGAPAWRAFPTIDPMNDLDWLIQHDDDMIVRHTAPDARVDAAIAAVAQPFHLRTSGVKAWRGVVNGYDTVFLRAKPQVVRIARAENAEGAARELVAHDPLSPSFHGSEALRMQVVHPAATMSQMPRDISEARMWVDSLAADASADVYVEADCPDAAAARADAKEITELVHRKNSFAVRLITAGLLNNVAVTTVGPQVHVHVHASQQQIEALIALAPSMVGAAAGP